MWWRVARRGPAAPGPPPPGATGNGKERRVPPSVRRRGGGDERREVTAPRGPPACPLPARGTPATPPGAGTLGTRWGAPQRERGKWGGLGGGEDAASAPRLLPSSLTSGRRKQLGAVSLKRGWLCPPVVCPPTALTWDREQRPFSRKIKSFKP